LDGEEYKVRVKEAKCSGNIMYTCIKMEKWSLLKLFQEWGRKDKEEWWRDWTQLWYIVGTFVNILWYIVGTFVNITTGAMPLVILDTGFFLFAQTTLDHYLLLYTSTSSLDIRHTSESIDCFLLRWGFADFFACAGLDL
jgi:hypothetical protein